MRIALLQMLPGSTLEENLAIGTAACRKAKQLGADVALFPEMWSNGYHLAETAEAACKEAIGTDSPFVQAFAALAAELEMAVAITLLEKYDPLPRNSLILFDRHGKRVFTYAKVHTCDFDAERRLTPGDDFFVAGLDTVQGVVQVGAMICYDREFPESARIMMLKGAEIVLVANACPMEVNRLSQLRSRAFENMMGVATCNYPQGQPDCNGHSSAFDGVAWPPDHNGSHDMCVLQAGPDEGVYIADFDLEKMRGYRRVEIFGNAYRHPQKYHALIDERIREPFIRDNYRQ